MANPTIPEGHPVPTVQAAAELMTGAYGDACREILKGCCFPVFWHEQSEQGSTVLHSGTVTVVRTQTRLFGITAAHVVSGYINDRLSKNVALFFYEKQMPGFQVIDSSDNHPSSRSLDVATIELDEDELALIGKPIIPLSFPFGVPEEGRGIMLAGYPGIDRVPTAAFELDFGLFTALGVARTVTHDQITWAVNREDSAPIRCNTLPPSHDLGGISGGPLIGWFETPAHIATYRLCAIISESRSDIENVVAKRVDCIDQDGKIHPPGIY
ncbi:hypothetical protein VPK21_004365 [Sinorhizobium kummerowiae]|uniref:Serine protease n=1 Tax=Sinorhizobium kummerowiae TaxID=158892 RepID=A0ABY8T8W8_9HYPH|nr:hypothetical protein [Sinorhizobium kummerowiae]WHS94242.1 hypothetical protein PZL22_001948 [Sinorhizobium kummerowiae]WRW46172.1 hypothetical protein VPK21_004365 [Sinorhizobium kummerowiae]